ncbi:COX15/CtaA family protein [sulfur-oxidizing endosymbiont of Gigantopelta aegis]|uniref:COX15/CtaA family protein n=1 Tax=sulfur-oxidizing endosymbiont of Gigantopelta aegis TaxID=2794934 RepID=UPI0018DC969F|nr:COX15/CtaA family protein [sulfur-oxidizing endosymbiont of Gigantopelta aegis]
MNFHKLALITTLIALMAIMLGAYTRLSNAGLGCPDWPGCYGHLNVPDTAHEISKAQEAYPDKPIEAAKAWKEMTHRYIAGTLGLFILALCLLAWKNRKQAGQAIVLPTILVGIVIFQALLGMWTVTLLLKPLVVVVHLIFGFTTLAILFWLTLSSSQFFTRNDMQKSIKAFNCKFRKPALIAVVILFMQIALGGWTSSNYAALVCSDLPTCQSSWWPEMNFKEAFTLWHEHDPKTGKELTSAINYEGGILDFQARTAIHWMHRIGAVITFLYLFTLGLTLFRKAQGQAIPIAGLLIIGLVIAQFSLGLSNVFFNLPLLVAVAHNVTAALLLLSLILLNYLLFTKK